MLFGCDLDVLCDGFLCEELCIIYSVEVVMLVVEFIVDFYFVVFF